jgi:hypothetical protein
MQQVGAWNVEKVQDGRTNNGHFGARVEEDKLLVRDMSHSYTLKMAGTDLLSSGVESDMNSPVTSIAALHSEGTGFKP